MHPDGLKYSPQHIWLKDEGNGNLRLGITYYYQEQLKSVVFLELPGVGAELKRGEPFATIESSKVSTDLTSPVSGTVIDANLSVTEKPGLINKDPYGQGWLLVVRPSQPDELKSLLSAAKYLAIASGEAGEGPWGT